MAPLFVCDSQTATSRWNFPAIGIEGKIRVEVIGHAKSERPHRLAAAGRSASPLRKPCGRHTQWSRYAVDNGAVERPRYSALIRGTAERERDSASSRTTAG